jgi:hypothetical protein
VDWVPCVSSIKNHLNIFFKKKKFHHLLPHPRPVPSSPAELPGQSRPSCCPAPSPDLDRPAVASPPRPVTSSPELAYGAAGAFRARAAGDAALPARPAPSSTAPHRRRPAPTPSRPAPTPSRPAPSPEPALDLDLVELAGSPGPPLELARLTPAEPQARPHRSHPELAESAAPSSPAMRRQGVRRRLGRLLSPPPELAHHNPAPPRGRRP